MRNQNGVLKIGLDYDLKVTNCKCGLDNPKTGITHNYKFYFKKFHFPSF